MKKIIIIANFVLILSASNAMATNWAVDLYGGVRVSDNLSYGNSNFSTDSGQMYGIALYRKNLAPNWEFGADLSVSKAHYTGFVSSNKSTALMVMARYNFYRVGGLTAYGSAGLGAVRVKYDGASAFPAFTGSQTKLGGQIGLGATYTFGALKVFSEIRYQEAFSDANIAGIDVEYKSTDVLVGIRFDF